MSTRRSPCDAGRDLGDCDLYLVGAVAAPGPSRCELDVSDARLELRENRYPALRVWTGVGATGDRLPERSGPTDCGNEPGFYLSDRSSTLDLCEARCEAYELLVACAA